MLLNFYRNFSVNPTFIDIIYTPKPNVKLKVLLSFSGTEQLPSTSFTVNEKQ